MARIRTIKPSFWTSEQIVELSTTARLLFIGMWNFADDNGILPASAKTLKMQVFAGDDFTAAQIQNWVNEMIVQGLIVEYQADNRRYWIITGWHHQKIDRPNSLHPKPEFVERSSNDLRAFDEQSPPEGKGREGNSKGEDKKKKKSADAEILQASENEKPAPLPHPDDKGDEPEKIIRQWGAATKWEWVSGIARETGYDPARCGNVTVNQRATLFCGYHAENENFQADPVAFFKRAFKGYLTHAMTNPPRSTKNGKSPPASPPQAPAITREIVIRHIETAHSGFAKEFTDRDVGWLCQSKDMIDLQERAADKVKQKVNQMKFSPPRKGSESTLSTALAGITIKPEA